MSAKAGVRQLIPWCLFLSQAKTVTKTNVPTANAPIIPTAKPLPLLARP
jgi:hypothetical protein